MRNINKFTRFVKVFTLLVLITYLTTGDLHAQENPRWHISLSGGWALPVGAYQKIAPEKAVANTDGSDEINGFDKKGNSAAKAGYAFNIGLRYRVQNNWHLTATAGYSLNTVNTEVINNYLNDYANENWFTDPTSTVDYRFDFNQQDYQVLYYLAGVAYGVNHGRWQLSLNPQIGLGSLLYPDYNIVYLWITNNNSALRHEGETPSIQALMWGGSLQTSYQLSTRLSAGIMANYLSADFPYEMGLRLVPGGSSGALDKSDEVTYRQVQLGFQLGYRF
jgi:hypothetical protein